MDEQSESTPELDPTDERETQAEGFEEAEPVTSPTVGTPRWWIPVSIIGAVVLFGLLASQAYLIFTLDETRTELAATSSQVNDLETQIAEVTGAVGSVGRALNDLAAAQSGPGSSPAPSVTPGTLPRFSDGQADQAIGLTLGEVTGPDAYSEETVTVVPSDGTKRIWMVWAHWCPYCQEELPALSAAYASLQATYPDIEITTVTTSIDPSRGNPLDAYLAAEQFPFPVIVDRDLALAAQMGVSAFPFWIVTDGDGRVLFRTAGYLNEAQVDGLMQNLDEYDPSA